MMPSEQFQTKADVAKAVREWGILPFFSNSIPGFSIEERADPAIWFTNTPGPWEWKGELIRENRFAYGKFFEKKAAFLSPAWFCDLANFRRDGYDFDALYDDGKAYFGDKELFDRIDAHAPILSKELKKIGNYGKHGKKGFDTRITRLQSQGYVLVSDFIYATDRRGREYGWGIAQYSTPEKFFGVDFCNAVYQKSPEESYERLFCHLKKLFPQVPESTIRKFLR